MPGEADILATSTPRPDSQTPRAGNDKKGGFCPFGHGLLERARVEPDDGGDAFYLERCRACSGVFFDDGEWSRLAHSQMFHHLNDLWDPHFQQKIAEERSIERWRSELAEKITQDNVDILDRLAEQLSSRHMVSEAIAYLIERVREHTAVVEIPPASERHTRKVDAVLLHVVPATKRLSDYTPESLASEGFVHLCHRDQLLSVLERHFSMDKDLDARASREPHPQAVNIVILDVSRLLSPVKEEQVGTHGVFPHLYGPLRSDAILRVVPVAAELGHDEVLRLVDDAIEMPYET
jgi:uncharacterized protein (DUF952 family)